MPDTANRDPGVRTDMGELWRACNREIHERFREAFRGSDLPLGVMILLRQISREPGVTVSELARRSGVAKSHASNMMDQLVRRGMIEKKADPDDQRLVRVYLTPAATAKISELEDRAQGAWAAVVDEIPEGQSAEVAHGLRILLEALRKSNGKVRPS